MAAGVAQGVVARSIEELKQHFVDIETDAVACGLSANAAQRLAQATIGSDQDIVAAFTAQDELLCWSHRWPRAARGIESLCYCVLLPATPFIYCAQRGSTIVRWGVSTSLAAVVTGSLLLSLQWLIIG